MSRQEEYVGNGQWRFKSGTSSDEGMPLLEGRSSEDEKTSSGPYFKNSTYGDALVTGKALMN